jgi:hypothetical protein
MKFRSYGAAMILSAIAESVLAQQNIPVWQPQVDFEAKPGNLQPSAYALKI